MDAMLHIGHVLDKESLQTLGAVMQMFIDSSRSDQVVMAGFDTLKSICRLSGDVNGMTITGCTLTAPPPEAAQLDA